MHICAFAVSGYAGTAGRTTKPFNPLLGETYEFVCQEKVKHRFEKGYITCHLDVEISLGTGLMPKGACPALQPAAGRMDLHLFGL